MPVALRPCSSGSPLASDTESDTDRELIFGVGEDEAHARTLGGFRHHTDQKTREHTARTLVAVARENSSLHVGLVR